ncbi:Short-chain dehydrogenase/reductase SDR [Penicillium soppii]|uniref:Short-chain dehydrogenase/reductase SDR n=1 Tax=Penicillium soppii TaxID=69789 RepID=UPI0025493311|nr:Short-chain dehydrogenase/reductase SDR [Penicillium soppii]KAJ5875974.1 Short-chain dehydrogenase/reductase SDR [Penicillium soppii]
MAALGASLALAFHAAGLHSLGKFGLLSGPRGGGEGLSQDGLAEGGMQTLEWGMAVVGDLLKKKPPMVIWRGGAGLGREID